VSDIDLDDQRREPAPPPPPVEEEESPFDRTQPPFAEATGDAEPMHAAHEEDEAADVFEPAEDVSNTLTMADLYARQGLADDARHIYESLLARDPANEEVRAKLDALTPSSPASPAPPSADAKVERLKRWLSKISRKEVGGV